jgi:hypothetical protein
MEEQSEALRVVGTSESQLRSLYDDLARSKEMLQLDKSFLQKEVAELVAKDHQSQRMIENQSTKIVQLEGKVMTFDLHSHLSSLAYGTYRSAHTYSTNLENGF